MLGYSYEKRFGSNQTFSRKNTPTFLKPRHSSYLPAYEDGTDRVFRNVSIQNSDAGELPRRKHTNCQILFMSCTKIFIYFVITMIYSDA